VHISLDELCHPRPVQLHHHALPLNTRPQPMDPPLPLRPPHTNPSLPQRTPQLCLSPCRRPHETRHLCLGHLPGRCAHVRRRRVRYALYNGAIGRDDDGRHDLRDGNLFSAMFMGELMYRADNIFWLSQLHHISTVGIMMTVYCLSFYWEKHADASTEIYLCMVWGAYSLSFFPPSIVRQITRQACSSS
jgi:hypothetical protein